MLAVAHHGVCAEDRDHEKGSEGEKGQRLRDRVRRVHLDVVGSESGFTEQQPEEKEDRRCRQKRGLPRVQPPLERREVPQHGATSRASGDCATTRLAVAMRCVIAASPRVRSFNGSPVGAVRSACPHASTAVQPLTTRGPARSFNATRSDTAATASPRALRGSSDMARAVAAAGATLRAFRLQAGRGATADRHRVAEGT